MALRVSCASLLPLALCVLVGCGSSDGEPDATTLPASDAKLVFLARGDAICADGQTEAAELARRAAEVRSQSESLDEAEMIERTEGIWTDQIALTERFRVDLAALDAPFGDEARVDEFLRGLDDGIAAAKEIEATLAGGAFPPTELVREYADIVVRGNTLASAYGFTVCGRTG